MLKPFVKNILIILAIGMLSACNSGTTKNNSTPENLSLREFQSKINNSATRSLTTLATTSAKTEFSDNSNYDYVTGLKLDPINYQLGAGIFTNSAYPTTSPWNEARMNVNVGALTSHTGILVDANYGQIKDEFFKNLDFDVKNSRLLLSGYLQHINSTVSNDTSVAVLVYSKQLYPISIVPDPNESSIGCLTSTANKIMTTGNDGPQTFAQKYGDSFVSGGYAGVISYLKYQFNFQDSASADKFRGAITGQFGSGNQDISSKKIGANLDSEFIKALTKSGAAASITVEAFQAGGDTTELARAITVDELGRCKETLVPSTGSTPVSHNCDKLFDSYAKYLSQLGGQISTDDVRSTMYFFPHLTTKRYNEISSPLDRITGKPTFSAVPASANIDANVTNIQNQLGYILARIQYGRAIIDKYKEQYKNLPPDVLQQYNNIYNLTTQIVNYFNDNGSGLNVLTACFGNNITKDCPSYFNKVGGQIKQLLDNNFFMVYGLQGSLQTSSFTSDSDNLSFTLVPLIPLANNKAIYAITPSSSKNNSNQISLNSTNPSLATVEYSSPTTSNLRYLELTANLNINNLSLATNGDYYSASANNKSYKIETTNRDLASDLTFGGCYLRSPKDHNSYYNCTGVISATPNDSGGQRLAEKFSQLVVSEQNPIIDEVLKVITPQAVKPIGSYTQTCSGINYTSSGLLSANCPANNGTPNPSSLKYLDECGFNSTVINNNGKLQCSEPIPLGDYRNSCSSINYIDGKLSAECDDMQHKLIKASLAYNQLCASNSSVENFHGYLVCQQNNSLTLTGNYAKTCKPLEYQNGILTAVCLNTLDSQKVEKKTLNFTNECMVNSNVNYVPDPIGKLQCDKLKNGAPTGNYLESCYVNSYTNGKLNVTCYNRVTNIINPVSGFDYLNLCQANTEVQWNGSLYCEKPFFPTGNYTKYCINSTFKDGIFYTECKKFIGATNMVTYVSMMLPYATACKPHANIDVIYKTEHLSTVPEFLSCS